MRRLIHWKTRDIIKTETRWRRFPRELKSSEAMLPRKTSKDIVWIPVPRTNTGGQGENPKVSERTMVKELGKMTP